MRRSITAFLAYPVFMVVNGLAALELSLRLRHSSFTTYIRVDSWISIAVGLAVTVWYIQIEVKQRAGDPSINARRMLFLVFFFLPWGIAFALLLIESFRLNYVSSSNIHWCILLQMFATLIIWITWECRLIARSATHLRNPT